jgi:hypothetical protein
MNTLSEVWCAKCDQPSVVERRQGDETVAFCKEHDLDAQWKANSPSWRAAAVRTEDAADDTSFGPSNG